MPGRFVTLTSMRFPVLLLGFAVLAGAAESKTFSSGENRVHLLELYSSEGCSSCPPAEQWLGNLREAPGLWRDFVPVAFHVDYWDRLGWRDKFARKEYTARQYAYSSQWRSDTVYTPEFVLDGAEWRYASGAKALLPLTTSAGVLEVNYDDGICRISFAKAGDYQAHAALLGGGIVSKIGSGENGGRALHHDFVALNLSTTPLKGGAAQIKMPSSDKKGIPRLALAVWVTKRGELTPLQATGGWID